MGTDILLTAVGILGVVVAALSSKMRRLPLSEPLLGLGAGVLIGAPLLDVFHMPPITEEHSLLHEVSRILLAISVMAVALRYPIADVRRCWRPVTLLLLVAMPVMAVVTTGLSWLFLSIPIAAAALLGAALCPTDPVLASSVVTRDDAERDLPARDRQLLSLESGANDGLALPLVLAAIAITGGLSAGAAIQESLWQVFGGVMVGAAMGWAGGFALKKGDEFGATAAAPALFFTLVLALGIVGVAGLVHTDGILAVFVGGLLFNLLGTVGSGRPRCRSTRRSTGSPCCRCSCSSGRRCHGSRGSTWVGRRWLLPSPFCCSGGYRSCCCCAVPCDCGPATPVISGGSARSGCRHCSISRWKPSGWASTRRCWRPAPWCWRPAPSPSG